MKKGDVVVSTAGHDMGDVFLIDDTLGEYAFIVDGKNRTLDKPKKKKLKHLVKIGDVEPKTLEKITSGKILQDAEVRKQLKVFKNQIKENVCQRKM